MCHILLLSLVIYVRELWAELRAVCLLYTVSCLVVFVLFLLPALTLCDSGSLCSNSVVLLVSTASVEQLWWCVLKILKKCINMEMVKISFHILYGGFKWCIYTTLFSTKNCKLKNRKLFFSCDEIKSLHILSQKHLWCVLYVFQLCLLNCHSIWCHRNDTL